MTELGSAMAARADFEHASQLDEVDLLHSKTPYQNAMIEQGLLIE